MLSERPGSSADTTLGPKDLTGKSIKEKRVRMVHSADSALPGASLYFQEKEPWLAYQRGKDLTLRDFRKRDGVFGQEGVFFGRLISDRTSPKVDRDHASGCGVCHNTPYRDAGAGANIPKNGGEGRNTPHFFGGGLVEMIGLQTRLKVMERCDPDQKGYIPKNRVPDRSVLISPAPGAPAINYGRCGDNNGDGRPDLNKIFRIWYVDANGQRVFEDHNNDGVVNLKDPNVAGYNFEMAIFGWGDLTGAMTATLRTFFAEPSDTHTGMQAYDPTTNEDDGSGLAHHSNAGAQQFALHATPDRGLRKTAQGISLDDPDGDGALNEISEGDLDMAEWYMLHAPTPATGEQTARTQRGKRLFTQWKCAACHVPDWAIEAADPQNGSPYRRYDGDRRFFDLNVSFNPQHGRLEGKVMPLYIKEGDRISPKRDSFTVKGVYSDFKHHDLGAPFHETQFDGSQITQFRTAPLWGVAGSAPYGHDGKDLSLDQVIRRHGGEAERSATTYRRAPAADRDALIAFLNSLVLYQTDELPADINGDGRIADHFMVAGRDTGVERFNVEYLFNHPCRIEGPVSAPDGARVTSYACMNVAEAYQEELVYIRDQDNDGFPDVSDPCPTVTGYLDGCHSTPAVPSAALKVQSESVPISPLIPLGGPEGGVVNVIAFDPQDPSVVYAGLDGGGIFKSVDGGAHWQPRNDGMRYRDVMGIAIHPAIPQILYVTTGGGIYKSLDGAQSWMLVNDGIDEPISFAIAIHPRSPDTLYVGTMRSLYKTVDGGAHWRPLAGGLPHHAHGHALLIDVGGATTPSLDQRPVETVYAGLEGAGVYASVDGGETWAPRNDGLRSLEIRALAQNPQLPSVLYAGGSGPAIFKSTDGGRHWNTLDTTFGNSAIDSIIVNPIEPTMLYVAAHGKGVFRSTDGGEQWDRVSIEGEQDDPVCLAIHPWSPGLLFVGTQTEGVFHSSDGGMHWRPASTGLTHSDITTFLIDPTDPKVFYLGSQRGLFISRDSGTHWERAGIEGRAQIVALVYDPLSLKVYAGTPSAGTFSTEDRGKSWGKEPLAPAGMGSVYFLSKNPTVDYMGTFGGLFTHVPQHDAWSPIGKKEFVYAQTLSVAVDPADPFHLYVGAVQGLFESKDGGQRWSVLTDGIGDVRIRQLLLHPQQPKTLYAGTEKGFFRSIDGGAHWTQPADSPTGIVTTLLINPTDSDILVAGTSVGLYLSADGGEHWSRKETGSFFQPLAVDPVGTLLGTDGAGVEALPLESTHPQIHAQFVPEKP